METRSGARQTSPSLVKTLSKPKVRVRKGALGDIQRMPREIVQHICSCVGFADLSNLSRVNTELRQWLRHPVQLDLWKHAAEREGLPDPPKTSDWYRFAALFAQNHCTACGKVGAGFTNWDLRFRCCVECEPSVYGDWHEHGRGEMVDCVRRSMRDHPIGSKPNKANTVLYTPFGLPLFDLYVKADLQAVESRVNARFLHPYKDFDYYDRQYEPVAWSANRDARYEFIDTQHLDFEDEARFRGGMERYQVERSKCEEKEKDDFRTLRIATAKRYFEQSIYEERDWEPILDDPNVQKREELTERKWSNLRPKLDAIAAGNKQRRELRVRQQELVPLHHRIMAEWTEAFTEYALVPMPGDVFAFEEIQEVLANMWDEEVAIETAVQAAIARVPDWRDQIEQEIDDMAAEALGNGPDIALACFTCRHCASALAWPMLHTHRCLRINTAAEAGYRPSGALRLSTVAVEPIVTAEAFSVDKLEVDSGTSIALIALVRRSKLAQHAELADGPLSHARLDALGMRFRTDGCDPVVEGLCTWQQVRIEARGGHWHDSHVTVTIIPVEEVRAARYAIERNRISQDKSLALWRCGRCLDKAPLMKKDTADKHGFLCPRKGLRQAVLDEGKIKELIDALSADALDEPPPARPLRFSRAGRLYAVDALLPEAGPAEGEVW